MDCLNWLFKYWVLGVLGDGCFILLATLGAGIVCQRTVLASGDTALIEVFVIFPPVISV